MLRASLVGLMVLGAGCGAPSPAEQCRRIVSTTCKKLFECVAAQAASLYGDEAGCRTTQEAKFQCEKAKASCDIDPRKFDRCLADTAAASCTATSQPASCADVCSGTSGLSCGGVGSSVTGNGCTFTQDHCSDGSTYAVQCANSSCSCLVNGAETKTFTSSTDFCASSATAKPAANSACGWNIR